MVLLEYFIDIKGIDSASNGIFPGAECGQPYHLHVPIVLKSGSLNLLESSRPVQELLYPLVTESSLFTIDVEYIYGFV